MSNKPAPRCPGCGKEMVMRWQGYYGEIASVWYVCDCGWRSPDGYSENEAYNKAMQRYRPVYDGYQGETQSENSSHGCKVYGGGEVNLDVPPGRYPMICQSTRETDEGHAAGRWISVRDELPAPDTRVLASAIDNDGESIVVITEYTHRLYGLGLTGWIEP